MPWRSLPDYLETIIELQINIEIGLEAEQLDGVSRASFRAVAERLQRNGCRITLHGPFWDLCPGSSDSLVRQVSHFRFHQLYDLVEVFRPIQVVCHTGFDPDHHGGQHDGYRERSLAIWEPLVARAEALRVPLLLENVWEHWARTSPRTADSAQLPLLRLLSRCGAPAQFLPGSPLRLGRNPWRVLERSACARQQRQP